MKLEHYSNHPGLMEHGIDPAQHGSGVSGDETKRKRNDPKTWVDRSYHYVAGTAPEPALGAKSHVYTSEVPDEKIYDFLKDPAGIKEKSMWGSRLDPTLYEHNIKQAGYYGYINHGADGMGHAVALFHPIKPIGVRGKGQMNKTDQLAKGKNVREQRAAVFGQDAQPPRMSDKRIKMMRHIKDVVKHVLGLDLETAKGKINPETGKLYTPVKDLPVNKQPYDPYTDKGVAAEHKRLAEIKRVNETRKPVAGAADMSPEERGRARRAALKNGESNMKRIDPKPDWRSGKLQTQPSPDAAIHEIAHLLLAPGGESLGDTQESMDHQFGQVIKNIGFLKQKMTQGEIQPMALENKIRRTMGLPSNNQHMNARPMDEHDRPVEQALDQPTPRFVRGVADTNKGPQSVDLIRQTRLLSPANAETFDKFIRGEVEYHPEKGWQPAQGVNAKINQRARAAYDDPNPETNFARKDRDTLMRSEGSQLSDYHRQRGAEIKAAKGGLAKSQPSMRNMRALLNRMKQRNLGKSEGCSCGSGMELLRKLAKTRLTKDDPSVASQGVSGSTVDSGAASAASGSFKGAQGSGAFDNLAGKAANFFKSGGKWPVPGMVPPSGDKSKLSKHVDGVPDKKYDSCVSQVKAKGTGNPYAICTASLKKISGMVKNLHKASWAGNPGDGAGAPPPPSPQGVHIGNPDNSMMKADVVPPPPPQDEFTTATEPTSVTGTN